MVKRIIQHIVWTFGVTRLRIRSIWVSAILVVCSLSEWVISKIRRLRDTATPVRVLLSALLLSFMALPSLLYYIEHVQRMKSDQAFQDFITTSTNENQVLRESLESLLNERSHLQRLILEAGLPVYDDDGTFIVKVVATGYSSSVIETDNSPYITAANTRTRPGVVALSRDLLQRYNPDAPFNFGDRIYVDGLGEFTVEDSMHHRWQKRMDIWFPSRREAVRFGKRNLYISKLSSEKNVTEEYSSTEGISQ